jgi:hypothetical protein
MKISGKHYHGANSKQLEVNNQIKSNTHRAYPDVHLLCMEFSGYAAVCTLIFLGKVKIRMCVLTDNNTKRIVCITVVLLFFKVNHIHMLIYT